MKIFEIKFVSAYGFDTESTKLFLTKEKALVEAKKLSDFLAYPQISETKFGIEDDYGLLEGILVVEREVIE